MLKLFNDTFDNDSSYLEYWLKSRLFWRLDVMQAVRYFLAYEKHN